MNKMKKNTRPSFKKIGKALKDHEIGACYDKQRILNIFSDLGYDKEETWKSFEHYMRGQTIGLAIDSEFSEKGEPAMMVPLYYFCDLQRFLLNNCDKDTQTLD